MTKDENTSDIIDIDSESVIENEAIVPTPTIKSSRKYGVFGFGVFALLASAALGGWFYKDVLSTYLPSNQIQSMSARIDVLEAANKVAGEKIDAVVGLTDEIKSHLGAAQTAAEEARKLATATKAESTEGNSKLLTVEKSLADVAKRIEDLKTKMTTGTQGNLSADNSGLVARLDKLEKDLTSTQQLTTTKSNVTLLSQALTDLTEKITSGASFKDEIQRISQMVPAAEGLDILTSNADKGAATPRQLANSLKGIAAELAPKSETTSTPEDNSWWGKASSIMSGLVTVKSSGSVDWQQTAAQSGALVEQGQIGDALKMLEQNLESLPKPLQDWRIMAAKRFSVDQALEQVSRAISREIMARG